MKRLVALIVLLLASCTQAAPGNRVEKEFDRTGQVIQLEVVTYRSSKDLDIAYTKAVGFDSKVHGWSMWSESTPGQCRIHVLDIKSDADPELLTWGHELAHCVYGAYHQ